jgi:hypothetical protein
MKLSTGLNIIGSRNISKTLSKKILLANTSDRSTSSKILDKTVAKHSDPIFYADNEVNLHNADIRYQNTFAQTALSDINYRNILLLFAENNEIKKAVDIIANEMAIMDSQTSKYPVYPKINLTTVPEDKQEIAKAIQSYIDNVFYPKLYKFYNFKDDGLIEKCKEFKIIGKLAYEIVFDSLKNPKDIIDILPIDPATLQKFKKGDYIYYVQRGVGDAGERVLHENQVILVEWNKYDYGYVSYVDKLRIPYNIMRSMQTAKVLWFAAKSQVRMHVKLAFGDVARNEGIQKLTEAKNQYVNKFTFSEDGQIMFNNKPSNTGYREFFTAETSSSGTPEIEEINSNGPDLTEVDSLQFWEKGYWKSAEIPYDRIDPNSSDSWGFTDVSNLRKIEINFGKLINADRKLINQIFIKPIIIQLTLKEAEIGADLSLLDYIKMNWVTFNEYEKLAELEIMQKKVDLATAISQFGEFEDSTGKTRKAIPLTWIIKNYMDYSPEQLISMETERKIENVMLGFNADGTEKEETIEDEEISDEIEDENDSAENIQDFDDDNF